MKRSPSRYTTKPKGTKSRSLLVHIVELSTVVVKVDIKVIIASLTQNHVQIPRLRDANELNNDGLIKLGDVH